MLFYFLIWFCLFVFSLLEINNLQKNILFFFLLYLLFSFFSLFCQMGNWNRLGWLLWIFQSYFYYFQDSDFEFGFARINEIIKLTFGNYTILLFVFSCIIFFSRLKLYLNIHLYHCLVCFFVVHFFCKCFLYTTNCRYCFIVLFNNISC